MAWCQQAGTADSGILGVFHGLMHSLGALPCCTLKELQTHGLVSIVCHSMQCSSQQRGQKQFFYRQKWLVLVCLFCEECSLVSPSTSMLWLPALVLVCWLHTLLEGKVSSVAPFGKT